MQLKKFLSDNIPLGKGAIKIPAAELIERYRKQYDAMKAQHMQFKHDAHYVMPGGRVVVHIKVPSESVPNFYYDVLLELKAVNHSKQFEDCHIKIFSNCPSFVYTYAYVFYHLNDPDLDSTNLIIDRFDQKIPKDRLMVKGAEKKLGEEVLTNSPVVRNPYGLPLFDKSVYYAIFYLMENLNFDRVIYNKKIITETQLLKSIPDFEKLMTNRKALEQKDRNARKATAKDRAKTFQSIERKIANANTGVKILKPTRAISANKSVSANKSAGVRRVTPINKK